MQELGSTLFRSSTLEMTFVYILYMSSSKPPHVICYHTLTYRPYALRILADKNLSICSA
jgi:hypothetical protein